MCGDSVTRHEFNVLGAMGDVMSRHVFISTTCLIVVSLSAPRTLNSYLRMVLVCASPNLTAAKTSVIVKLAEPEPKPVTIMRGVASEILTNWLSHDISCNQLL